MRATMVLTYYIKLFRTGADRHNDSLIFLFLRVAETIRQTFNFIVNYSSIYLSICLFYLSIYLTILLVVGASQERVLACLAESYYQAWGTYFQWNHFCLIRGRKTKKQSKKSLSIVVEQQSIYLLTLVKYKKPFPFWWIKPEEKMRKYLLVVVGQHSFQLLTFTQKIQKIFLVVVVKSRVKNQSTRCLPIVVSQQLTGISLRTLAKYTKNLCHSGEYQPLLLHKFLLM